MATQAQPRRVLWSRRLDSVSIVPSRAFIRRGMPPVVGAVLFAAAWQWIGATQAFGGSIPSLTAVVREIWSHQSLLLSATTTTLGPAALGGAIGLLLGTALAALAALFPRSHEHVVRSVVLINAIPVVAIGPILMSLPVRPATPAVFAALTVLFSTVMTVSDGFRAPTESSRHLFSVYGAGPLQRLLRLQIPAALPYLADAVRLGVPGALLGAILGEWFGANSGLGVVMVSAMHNIQIELLWAAATMAVIVSILGYTAASVAERAANRFFGRPTVLTPAPTGRYRGLDLALGLLVPLALIGAWQWWVVGGHVATVVAPSPREVAQAFSQNWGTFLQAAGGTLATAAVGLALGAALGVALAITATLFPVAGSALSPLALLIPTIPIVVFIPVVGAIIGYGTGTVVVSCVLMTFFPVYVIVLSGLGSRPPGSDDLFRVHGAGRFVTLIRLAIPASLPSAFLALRISAAGSVLTAIAAEWLMDYGGLGKILSDDQVNLDTSSTWAAVIVAVVMSVAVYWLAVTGERWAAKRWN